MAPSFKKSFGDSSDDLLESNLPILDSQPSCQGTSFKGLDLINQVETTQSQTDSCYLNFVFLSSLLFGLVPEITMRNTLFGNRLQGFVGLESWAS